MYTRLVDVGTGTLQIRAKRTAMFRSFVNLNAKAVELLDYGVDRLRPRPGRVEVFDAQDEISAIHLRKQPRQESGSQVAGMQQSAWCWCESSTRSCVRHVSGHLTQ